MKAIKMMEYSTQAKLALSTSYRKGWAKSLENFEKHLRDSGFKTRRSKLLAS